MRSMTGFGTGTAKSDNLLIVTEIKSPNCNNKLNTRRTFMQ